MAVVLGNDWQKILKDEFEQPYYAKLRSFLAAEYRKTTVFPPMDEIFTALRRTPYEAVKVVILGQDPYHETGQAHGLAFSVKRGVPLPPSLKNIYRELSEDLGIEPASSGCLLPWADQGVLLLNTVLTVREGAAASHQGRGWETLTDAIIKKLGAREKPMVFLLWGRMARSKKQLISGSQHLVLEAPHPSPLSAHSGFFGCRHFSKANAFLEQTGQTPIEWTIPEEKPYYRVQAGISESALRHNVRRVRERLPQEAELVAVVKSNGYGHVVENVVPIFESEGIGFFAVASLAEGLRVRSVTAQKILVLGYTDPGEYEDAIRYHIEMTIYSLEQAKKLSEAAGNLLGKDADESKWPRIHLKVETGMNRIGLPCGKEGVEDAEKIARLPYVHLSGIFTHYARADEEDLNSAKEQLQRFESFVESLEARGIRADHIHSANSAAALSLPESFSGKRRYLVRSGILLYGIFPSKELEARKDELHMDLVPAMDFTSHIVHLKWIEKGEAVSYGGTYVAQERVRVATVPVGYGDGYPRRLSGKGEVLIRGKRAKIVGRVCMDQLMVDVTDIPEADLLDEVILFGKGLPLTELAEKAETIPYEIICQITDRPDKVMQA